MIIFRLFLYLVCALSLSWSIIVFGGPSLIKKVIWSYTDGAVQLSNVSVSPTLGVNIGKLDFNIGNKSDGRIISGHSRSNKIIWSFWPAQPFLILNVGPTTINNVLTVKHIEVKTPSYGSVNWDDLLLTVNANSLNAQFLEELDELYVVGSLNTKSQKIQNIEVTAKRFKLQNFDLTLLSDLAYLEIDQLALNAPLGGQAISGSFAVSDISNSSPDVLVSDISGKFDISGFARNFTIESGRTVFPAFGAFVDRLKFVGEYDQDYNLQKMRVNFFDGLLGEFAPQFSYISADISKTDSHYNAIVDGRLNEFDLYHRDTYLGVLPPSNFSIGLQVDDSKAKISAEPDVSFDTDGLADLNGSGTLELQTEQFKDITECTMLNCKILSLNFDYKINVDDDWVIGRSDCLESPCNSELMSYQITTSNTSRIFTTLNRLGVLSPLSSVYLYNAVIAGQKVESGHRLNF